MKVVGGLLWMIIFVLIQHNVAYARRAYFMGVTSYNDNARDANSDVMSPGSVRREQGYPTTTYPSTGESLGALKLFSCNLMISNLSPVDQKITGYSVSISHLYTSHISSLSGGSPVNPNDVLTNLDGSDIKWRHYAIKAFWQSGGAANEPFTMYKFNHLAQSSDLTAPASANNKGYTQTGAMSLSAGETAMITVGNFSLSSDGSGIGAGGGLYPRGIYSDSAIAGSSSWPFKEMSTCLGYIDVEDADPAHPGFVAASGVFESKAGSYQNVDITYGGVAAGNLSGMLGYHLYQGWFSNRNPSHYMTVGSDCSNTGTPSCNGTSAPPGPASGQFLLTSDPPSNWMTRGYHDALYGGPPFLRSEAIPGGVAWAAPRSGSYLYGAEGGGVVTGVDDPFAGFRNVSCSISSSYVGGELEPIVTANYQEILFNTPILINGGSPF